MKRLVHFAIALVVLIVPANSCGPFFAEAVFVDPTRPDEPYARYAAGHLGVPQPGYRVRHLVIAYDWLSDAPLSPAEQQQAIAVDRLLNPIVAAPDTALPGMAAWLRVAGASAPASLERSVPGEDFSTYVNCLDDAFLTAAQTYQARSREHPSDTAGLAEWLRGQNAVFSNCGEDAAVPATAPASASLWLRQDRAYQLAAASFYREEYTGAAAGMLRIAHDSASPWQGTARLVYARALVRAATVGPREDLPAEAAPLGPQARFSPAHEQAQEAYRKLLAQRRPARLEAAASALQAILGDRSAAALYPDARRLLDFVRLRLDPAAQAQVLAIRLSAPHRDQAPGVFAQALLDLTFLSRANPFADPPHDARTPTPVSSNGLLAWLHAYTGNSQGAAGSEPTLPWLLAKLSRAKPSDSSAALIADAAQVAPQSPGWVAATYHRLRLTPNFPPAELDRVLTPLSATESRSTINLFTNLRLEHAPTLAAFLDDAGTLPAGTLVDEEDPEPLTTEATEAPLCPVADGPRKVSPAGTRLFDLSAATVLNTRMPVALLAAAAKAPQLAPNLRFQVAQAAWARAVLLDQHVIAASLSPVLTACYPAWQPWLDRLDAAPAGAERQVAALLALMRFASTQPVVRVGEQRPEGFATYSEYRDNWWSQSRPESPAGATSTSPPTLFGETFSPRMADPPFLTPADRSAAAAEVERLRRIPCASDYFATEALAWQKQHPADPRTPDVLGFAERVIRNGCRTDDTAELNHRLFDVVQLRYPQSEWAKRYTSWE